MPQSKTHTCTHSQKLTRPGKLTEGWITYGAVASSRFMAVSLPICRLLLLKQWKMQANERERERERERENKEE